MKGQFIITILLYVTFLIKILIHNLCLTVSAEASYLILGHPHRTLYVERFIGRYSVLCEESILCRGDGWSFGGYTVEGMSHLAGPSTIKWGNEKGSRWIVSSEDVNVFFVCCISPNPVLNCSEKKTTTPPLSFFLKLFLKFMCLMTSLSSYNTVYFPSKHEQIMKKKIYRRFCFF